MKLLFDFFPIVLFFVACQLGDIYIATMAAALLIHQHFFKRNLTRAAMQAQMEFPDTAWARINTAWTGFPACMGAASILVAYGFSEDARVNYKASGIFIALISAVALMLSLTRLLPKNQDLT